MKQNNPKNNLKRKVWSEIKRNYLDFALFGFKAKQERSENRTP